MNDEEKKQRVINSRMRQLEREIASLESALNNIKLHNRKRKITKNIKIGKLKLQKIMPYALALFLVAGAYHGITKRWPFINDNIPYELNIKSEIDSTGNITYTKKYGTFSNTEEIITHCSAWKPDGNGFYKRRVRIYQIKNIENADIIDYIETKNFNLENILGKAIGDYEETSNNVSDEELEKGEYLSAVLYDVDTEDYIISSESISSNINDTLTYMIPASVTLLIEDYLRKKYSKFDYNERLREINREYIPAQTSTVEKKLKIKRDNYQRLKRG